jgi:hypothetical protein
MAPFLPLRRMVAAAGAVAIAIGAAACGGGDDNGKTSTQSPSSGQQNSTPANRTQRVTGGETVMSFDSQSRRLLERAGVRIEPIGEATRSGRRVVFPIAGGQLRFTPLSGRIEHRGGLRLSAGGAHVDATDLVVRPGRGVVTAMVGGHRVPLLSIEAGRPRKVPVSHAIEVPATVAFTGRALPDAADPLVRSVLRGGVRVGTLRIAADT